MDKKKLTKKESKGKWIQKVYQVDDSPRYEGIGTWVCRWENLLGKYGGCPFTTKSTAKEKIIMLWKGE